ncbi:hypothetical protein ACROYT_G027575 [Oculina patagonica]
MACCGYAKHVGGDCGSSTERQANGHDECVRLAECCKDIKVHLKTCCVSDSSLNSEATLLLARAAKLRHQHSEDDGVSDHEAALEQQQYWDTREQVLREVQLQHPVIYDNFDLCAMYDANRLNKLSVDMLKYICEYFDVNKEQLAVRRKKKVKSVSEP